MFCIRCGDGGPTPWYEIGEHHICASCYRDLCGLIAAYGESAETLRRWAGKFDQEEPK